jgi:hypothetical protein
VFENEHPKVAAYRVPKFRMAVWWITRRAKIANVLRRRRFSKAKKIRFAHRLQCWAELRLIDVDQ